LKKEKIIKGELLMKKITRSMFINWEGGADIWTQHDDLIEYFLSILNGKFDIEQSRKEILDYNEED